VTSRNITVVPVPGPGAEDVVVATHGPDEGAVFTGTEDGAIWRVSHDGNKVDRVAETGGRPLGIETDLDGRLLVCDARRGLLRVDTRTGGVEAVADSVDGVPMMFCNNAAIAGDGTVWFSDSSRKFGIADWKADFVQNTRTPPAVPPRHRRHHHDRPGRARLRQRRRARERRVVRRGGGDGRPHRGPALAHRPEARHARLPRAGPARLPGQHRPRVRRADLGDHRQPEGPTRRAAAAGPDVPAQGGHPDPREAPAGAKHTVRVQAFDDSGTVVHDVDVETPSYHMVTGVREHDGRVWLGSLHEPAVAVVDL
jgi:hypothetical protein